jgi:V8-like Glu-specific endopeptidase
VAALLLVAGACGGSGDGGTFAVDIDDLPVEGGRDDPDEDMADAGLASDADTRTADAETAPPAGAECPALADSLEAINAATYAVYAELITQTDAGPQLTHLQVGTAWGIEPQLLVTNAHVTQAFVDFALQGVQLSRALAVQAGTGVVVELESEVTHPAYTGDPLRSPDVGLFETREVLPATLGLAADDVEIRLGDEVQIVGFPGDVTDFIAIVPGETVPQATSLSGQVTALRVHDDTMAVTADNVDVIQHQAPTTPGTSGSSMVACGEVIGVNNAGTVNLIATPGADGSLSVDRQAAAANNFAVHVRHIRELLGLDASGAVPGAPLPVPATMSPMAVEPMGETPPPGGVLVLNGEVGDPLGHLFTIQVDEAGIVTGTSDWAGNVFALSGQFFEDGSVLFVDDAFEQSDGELRRGVYIAGITSDTTIEGTYFEEGAEENEAPMVAVLQ